jgi:hypothetical protein
MLNLKDKQLPMSEITQPRKLCLSFGIQLIGCSRSPMSAKAGTFVWVISAKLSRWTFHEVQRPTCQLADSSRGWPLGFQRAHSVLATAQAFAASPTPTSWVAPQDALPEHVTSRPKPAQPCERFLQRHRSASSSNSHPIPFGDSEQPKL